MEIELKGSLKETGHVRTTADIWSANNKSYLGMTVHCINETSLQCEKAATACKRVRGRHTYDAIGAEVGHSIQCTCGETVQFRKFGADFKKE